MSSATRKPNPWSTDLLAFLGRVDVFRGAPEESLASLLARARRHRFPAGELLMQQGTPGESLHVVVRGRVRVECCQPIHPDPLPLAELGPGEVVGEMGALDGAPRSASVRALEDTETLEFDAGALSDTVLSHPPVSSALLRTLSQRLRGAIAVHALEHETAHEEARTAAQAELSRLKSEFISVAAHELRTPLTTILGFSEVVLNQTPPDDPRHRFLSVIHADAVQLASLVEHLLNVSSVEDLHTIDAGWVRVAGLARPLLETVGSSSPRHRLHAVLDPALPVLWADAAKLQQVLSHLLSNAVKYSPAGGAVTLTVERLPDGGARLAVEDPGVGIPPEHQDRIFERFQRVDAKETRGIRGSGLGLYIVKHLVELHGGTISVRSTPGQGSTFTVILPPPPPDAPPPPASEPSTTLESKESAS